MRAFLKDIFFSLALLVSPRLGPRASILMYHSVSEEGDYFSAVKLKTFEAQMEYLARSDHRVISLKELVKRLTDKESISGCVALTFDDGYRDNLAHAFPVLRQHNFPATIFVDTDLIGKTDKRGMKRLTEEELKVLEQSGIIDVEPHTKSHPKLTNCTDEQQKDEIGGSKNLLETMLGKTCTLFAFPFGKFDERTIAILRSAGFSGAVSVNEGTVTASSDIFQLPRNSVDRTTSMTQFKGKLSRTIDLYHKLKI